MGNQSRHSKFALSLSSGNKWDVRAQFAALCYKKAHGRVRVLLVTSRDTGRWVLPKGWPIAGLRPPECAEAEAWEEAGVRGKVENDCVGVFTYVKELDTGVGLPTVVAVFPLKVESLEDTFPESGQRERQWVTQKRAAKLVDEPDLSDLLLRFDT